MNKIYDNKFKSLLRRLTVWVIACWEQPSVVGRRIRTLLVKCPIQQKSCVIFFFLFFGKEVLRRIALRYGTRPTLSLYTFSLTRETWIGPHFEELGHANRFSTSLISNKSGLLPLLETRGGFGVQGELL